MVGLRTDRQLERDRADGNRERTRADGKDAAAAAEPCPTPAQARYLRRGLDQPGDKLPLFDDTGAAISPRTIRVCVKQGWAEPWFSNPTKPDWLVCRLTPAGRAALAGPARKTRRGRSPT